MKNRIKFYTDQELDAENGLYNYNARLYDPLIGRFISPDTIVPQPYNPQSLNRYSYVLNNPLIYTDPSGHVNETALLLQEIYHAMLLADDADRKAKIAADLAVATADVTNFPQAEAQNKKANEISIANNPDHLTPSLLDPTNDSASTKSQSDGDSKGVTFTGGVAGILQFLPLSILPAVGLDIGYAVGYSEEAGFTHGVVFSSNIGAGSLTAAGNIFFQLK